MLHLHIGRRLPLLDVLEYLRLELLEMFCRRKDAKPRLVGGEESRGAPRRAAEQRKKEERRAGQIIQQAKARKAEAFMHLWLGRPRHFWLGRPRHFCLFNAKS